MTIHKGMAAVVLGIAVAAVPATSHAGVFIGITIAPPAIPVYVQPVAPAPDMIWTPGYWQWDASVSDYFWVPGAWVAAPQPGFLWTPGYWGFNNGYYGWNAGYWGPHIGYYGGVNYGFGFFGHGYEGGYWNNNHFFYNTAYSNVNVNIVHNTYIHNTTIINNQHTSYVGGQGGLQNRPSAGEQAAFREQHVAPTQVQQQHVQFARQDRGQFAQQNHGVPQAAALSRPVNSAQGFRQAAQPARAAGNNFQAQPGNSQQRGFMNDGGMRGPNQPGQQNNNGQPGRGFANDATRNQNQPGQFSNNGQQRGFAAGQPTNRPANTLNNGAAVNNRNAIGQGNVQADRQQVQQQRQQDFQQVQQQRQQDNQQAQQLRQQQQQQRMQDRQQVQQQRTQDRQQVQQQRQQAPRPAENHGGGNGGHEERPR